MYNKKNYLTKDNLIKKCWQFTAGRERLTPYQSKDPSPTIARLGESD